MERPTGATPSRTSIIEVDARTSLLVPDEPGVDGERASLLEVAANARSIAMLTGTHGVVVPPLEKPRVRLPSPKELFPSFASVDGDEREEHARLRARVAACVEARDAVAELRARLDLSRALLASGDVEEAEGAASAALEMSPNAPAVHATLRNLRRGRARKEEQLTAVDALIAQCPTDRARADWLAERARLLRAGAGSVENVDEAVARAYEEALALAGDHAAALFGLEATLEKAGRDQDLAHHIARLASLALTVDRSAAAWLHVERALILDRKLGEEGAARSALVQALSLAAGRGPVRDACVDFAVYHRDDAWLSELLESEAELEGADSAGRARAAFLELDAALASLRAGGDGSRATALLERAFSRAPTTALVDLRVGDELARLHDVAGRHADALRVRKAVLAWVSEPRSQLVLLRTLAASAERAGATEEAIFALESARGIDPDDVTLLDDLDRLLAADGRQEQRGVLWMREAARVEDPTRKARAFLVSAEAAKAAGREADVAKYLQSAWIAAPSAPGVYDALADRLAPAGARDVVTARVALYEQAVRTTKDPDKKIYFLEKIAWLWDDVAGDAAAAANAYEDVLAVEPGRMSAITGLASCATRAGDPRGVARALLAEADVTADPAWRAELRLRAADALSEVDAERALAIAEELRIEKASEVVSDRAAEHVTRLHAAGGRWELVAKTLSERQGRTRGNAKIALVLAEAAALSDRLRAPERALDVLARGREDAPGDPALCAATLATLEQLGDKTRLRAMLEELAATAPSPRARGEYLLRAAELDETIEGRDGEAARVLARARELLPEEAIFAERHVRIGARTTLPADAVPALRAFVRRLERGDGDASAEAILAAEAPGFEALRTAERIARRKGSAPQLANALAMQVDITSGMLALRALSGVAELALWTLPESDDIAPWDRLLSLGESDAAALDTLAARAMARARAGEESALALARAALLRRRDAAFDDTDRLATTLDLARLARAAGADRDAAAECRRALAIDGASFGAAALLAEVSASLGDRALAVEATKALAGIAIDPRARAALLQDAADLSAASGDRKAAASLLALALEAHPDAVEVAARLAELSTSLGAWQDLGRTLRRALRAATSSEAIVPIASELAEVARHRLNDPLLAIEALERAREVSAAHVPTLLVLAELYIGQRAWQSATDALAAVVRHALEPSEKLVALIGRASIFAKVLQRRPEAETELRAALEIDAHEPRALRGLLELGTLEAKERGDLLSRLVIIEGRADARLDALLELHGIRKAAGDEAGAEGALVEAAALSPDEAMLERVLGSVEGDSGRVRLLTRIVSRVREANRGPGASWLARLGALELELGRVDEAIERFEEAIEADAAHEDARLGLARALTVRGKHDAAFAALAPLLDASGRAKVLDPSVVRLLEVALNGAGRTHQATIARELRAVGGDLDRNGLAELDRRSVPDVAGNVLSLAALRGHVMPGGFGRHPIWDVANAVRGLAGKVARVSLADQGSSSRERVKPRVAHPIRPLFDYLVQALELSDVELAVSDSAAVPLVAVEDVPWLVVPASIAEWSTPRAIAAMAPSLVRVALGVPWLGALAPSDALAALIAFARQVAPAFGGTPTETIESLVSDYELRTRRAVDRKRRRSLEELEPVLEGAPLVAEATFATAIACTEARATFLLSGSLRATLESLAMHDPFLADGLRTPGPRAIDTVLRSPVSRDLAAYALGGEATALRRSLGTA